MALTLHRILQDGTEDHVEFSQHAWEACMRDASLRGFWGHDPSDCHDPVKRLREQNGYSAIVEVAPLAAEVPARVISDELIVWPPHGELHPWFFAEMAGICKDDAKAILRPWRELPPREKLPPTNKHGQFSLFG